MANLAQPKRVCVEAYYLSLEQEGKERPAYAALRFFGFWIRRG
ncbi:hypothetical protein VDG1235_2884 [Verrucomicrobiia bacterium DG1235]|nr:hypothetical protein VDG1235_2884 [Verrucomicrobiae bacterium DG1235]